MDNCPLSSAELTPHTSKVPIALAVVGHHGPSLRCLNLGGVQCGECMLDARVENPDYLWLRSVTDAGWRRVSSQGLQLKQLVADRNK